MIPLLSLFWLCLFYHKPSGYPIVNRFYLFFCFLHLPATDTLYMQETGFHVQIRVKRAHIRIKAVRRYKDALS
ncbi:hypothetical protein CLOSTHATH_02363, partial [Hungatella hathewayi DSM 13479]